MHGRVGTLSDLRPLSIISASKLSAARANVHKDIQLSSISVVIQVVIGRRNSWRYGLYLCIYLFSTYGYAYRTPRIETGCTSLLIR